MGGRLTLIQAVLSSIPVYWFGLTPIPISVLNKLRSITFSFLWGSSNNHHRYHLSDWKGLSLPYANGGWGIKNLHWFSLALRLKKFWSVLQKDGLWNDVVVNKYIKKHSVETWLRGKHFNLRGVSVFWKGFILTLPWIGKSLAWQVGCGKNVLIGTDPIIGVHEFITFPVKFKEYLEDIDITLLS